MAGQLAMAIETGVPSAFEAWAAAYRPIRNGIKPRNEFHGCLFDPTDEEELAFVRISDERKVWTFEVVGNRSVITPGFDAGALDGAWHRERAAIGFLVASIPREGEEDAVEFVIEENLDAMDRNLDETYPVRR